jgi:hypothetical protein
MGIFSYVNSAVKNASPKAMLSSAIANALSEYFVVDANQMESNLLTDAHILLKHTSLKRQIIRLPSHPEVLAVITAVVDQVEFAWTWSLGSGSIGKDQRQPDGWVQDSTLRIQGLKFQIELILESLTDLVPTVAASSGSRGSTTEIAVAGGDEKKHGLQGYIWKQVQMITLAVTDFELTIVLPSQETKSIRIGGQKVELVALGRYIKEELDNNGIVVLKDTQQLQDCQVHKQRLDVSSFYASILSLTDDDIASEKHLMEPFTYSLEMTRIGDRFGGFGTGTLCTGSPGSSDLSCTLNERRLMLLPNSGRCCWLHQKWTKSRTRFMMQLTKRLLLPTTAAVAVQRRYRFSSFPYLK